MEDLILTLKDQHAKVITDVQISKNRMFALNIKAVPVMYFHAKVKDQSWLWHLRYGHLSFNGLKLLSTKVW